MQLHKRTLDTLADLICGHEANFVYRSSSYLTQFFVDDCDLDYAHDGSTRKWWVLGVLERLNTEPASDANLPSASIVRVIRELMDDHHFRGEEEDRDAALVALKAYLKRDGLIPYLDDANRCQLKHNASHVSSEMLEASQRVWTRAEQERRDALARYLETASEDEFTEKILAPLFRQLRYKRISVSGHKDKSLEFGIDLWMKYQLPTGHMLYFAIQAKKGKIDATANSKNTNAATLINQARMAIGQPIFDPDNNREHLLDHFYIVTSGDITKSAKQYIGRALDQEMRRHIIFMDRSEILDLAIDIGLVMPFDDEEPEPEGPSMDDEIPF